MALGTLGNLLLILTIAFVAPFASILFLLMQLILLLPLSLLYKDAGISNGESQNLTKLEPTMAQDDLRPSNVSKSHEIETTVETVASIEAHPATVKGQGRSVAVSPDEAATTTASTLVVLVHGWRHSPEHLNALKGLLETNVASVKVETPQYNGGFLSSEDPESIVSNLVDKIDIYCKGNTYNKIILIGHSLGALLVRDAFMYGLGSTGGHEERPPRSWVKNIDRLILLASPNRGWSFWSRAGVRGSQKRGIGEKTVWLIYFLASLIFPPVGLGHFIMKFQRGAPYIANLRLRSCELTQAFTRLKNKWREKLPESLPPTIFLLGTNDSVIINKDEDYLDTASGSGEHSFHQELSNTSHYSIISVSDDRSFYRRLKDSLKRKDASRFEIRKNAFLKSLNTSIAQLPEAFTTLKPQIENDKTDAVFIMHGIRSAGSTWRQTIENLIKQSRSDGTAVPISSEYGYFSTLEFLSPWLRLKNVRWFIDQYTMARMTYPNAKIHYIGHSNGTYILAKALEEYQELTLEHVAFVGSVVWREFPWQELLSNKRVKCVRNDRSATDIIVACLAPRIWETLGSRELGTASVYGFRYVNARHQMLFNGGHSFALADDNLASIVDFIFSGASFDFAKAKAALETKHKEKHPDTELFSKEVPAIVHYPSRFAIIIAIAVIYALYQLELCSWTPNEIPCDPTIASVLLLAVLLLTLWFL